MNPSPAIFSKIKSKYIMNKILAVIQKEKKLKLIKYSKHIQKKIGLSSLDYKNFAETIKLEIQLTEKSYGKFINIKEEDKRYYHIYFGEIKKSEGKKYISYNDKEAERDYIAEKEKVDAIKIKIDCEIKSFMKLFHDIKIIKKIQFSKFWNKNIKNMESMFDGCKSLKEIKFIQFNTENVTSMKLMFFECKKLQKIDLSIFKTLCVTDMSSMFSKCYALKNIIFSHIFAENVTDMSFMFNDCSKLSNLNLESFYTKNVKNMRGMFEGCSLLNFFSLKLDTSNVTDMSFMFFGCESLRNLTLKFNTEKVKTMRRMFKKCKNLKILNISSFTSQNLDYSDDMFEECPTDICVIYNSKYPEFSINEIY